MKTPEYIYFYNTKYLCTDTCPFWCIDIKNTMSYYRYRCDDDWTFSKYTIHDLDFSGNWKELTQDEFNELVFVDCI